MYFSFVITYFWYLIKIIRTTIITIKIVITIPYSFFKPTTPLIADNNPVNINNTAVTTSVKNPILAAVKSPWFTLSKIHDVNVPIMIKIIYILNREAVFLLAVYLRSLLLFDASEFFKP